MMATRGAVSWDEAEFAAIFMSSSFPDSAAAPVLGTVSAAGPGRDPVEAEVVALFDQFRQPLLRYVWSFGLPVADGEEVIQEAFLALYQHLRAGKSRENLRGWLFRVAHNLAAKRRYRARRDVETSSDAGAWEGAIDPGPSPEELVVSNQTRERLRAVVHALPEQDRRCLFLRAEGLRYREIAEVLDMSLGAVSLSLSRSLARVARSSER